MMLENACSLLLLLEKAISITYSAFGPVASVIQYPDYSTKDVYFDFL